MKDDVLVKVDRVSKKFCRDLKKSLWYGMCDVARELTPGRGTKVSGLPGAPGEPTLSVAEVLRPSEFWANRDISFELRRGESLGLIGHNGAGKTTLLKLLNGLIKPDQGKIEIRGRVGALIALGAGFNPVLTGRENIYVNASILGLSKKEIDGKLEEIIDFSEIGEFVDAPVQSYSSGMQVRLGFAVATAMNPDLLLVDEVLAVGDLRFKQKCYQTIKTYRENGGSVILVSHDMHAIQSNTDQCMFLDHGKQAFMGTTQAAIQEYFTAPLQSWEHRGKSNSAPQDPGNPFRLLQFELATADRLSITPSSPVKFSAVLENLGEPLNVFWGLLIWNRERSQRITTIVSKWDHVVREFPRGRRVIEFAIESLPLAPGAYSVDFCLWNDQTLFPLAESWEAGCSLVLPVVPADEIDNRQVTNDDMISAKFVSVDWGRMNEA
jgi:lipopolysaccharide transport system ATP-binding protein